MEILSLSLMTLYILNFYAIAGSVGIFRGGQPNSSIVISEKNFRVTKGELKTFSRDDLDAPRVRYFCVNCGTHICVESPPRPGMLVLKIGTLDDHSWFSPQAAIYCVDKQPFHQIPEGIPSFERTPPQK